MIMKFINIKKKNLMINTLIVGLGNIGFKFGKDLFLAFCPERTIEGQAIEELKLH